MRFRRISQATASLALLLSPAVALATPLVIDGSVTNNTCPGGTVRDAGRACEYGGTVTFDSVELKNSAILYVKTFDGTNKATSGNLVLKSLSSITIDKTSRVLGKGLGYQSALCDNGPGPATAPLSGGRGGCSVLDSGGGGGHFGPGGRGTKDNPASYPAGYEESCGSLSGGACVSVANCYDGDALPTVAGQSFYHSIYDAEFGPAGGDKGCRDGDGMGAGDRRGGNGGARVVLFAANADQSGVLRIDGRVSADGNRGCAQGNDSAGGGAGGTILLVGDKVTVTATARVSSHGGRGGDSQPKCLPCTKNSDCDGGQTCQAVTDPQSKVAQMRCGPCDCTPCSNNAPCNTLLGQTCKDVGLKDTNNKPVLVCADKDNQCTPFDPGDTESECKGTQNSGLCDDCGGGGGGGIINVQSRIGSIDPLAIFDVRGSFGGVCPICTGEAGGGIGELQLDSAYVGEICDGKDNNFDGQVDEGLPALQCSDGTSPPSCVGGLPQTCPVDPATCTVPATDSRPRFTIVVDTSGSMLDDVAGNPLFGDGSKEFPGVNTGNPPKLYTAKSAVAKVIAAFPESSYALARYYQDVGPNRSCQTASNFECAKLCCSYDNPTDNVAPVYPTTYPDNQCVLSSLYPGANYPKPPASSVFTSDISIGWSTPTADCINYSGSCGPPRRGAQVLVGFDHPLNQYLSWLDHKEDNFLETPTDPEGNHCAGGDCEMRATGETPLAGALQATADYLKPIIACDGAKTCRKYATILLTDGAESCQGDPAAAATALLGQNVNTYVIGFSVQPGERDQLNAIAQAGGTNAAQFTGGTDKAFFATSEEELANALAAIIAGSQVFEKCNGIDDNCNNLIDEGFENKGSACDNGKLGVCRLTGAFQCSPDGSSTVCSVAGQAGPASSNEVCNGLDDDCNGFVDDGLNCQGCIPLPEVCNGKDDDCDGVVDNNPVDVGKTCGLTLGVCQAGITACQNGKLDCQGEIKPTAEVCNGLDDDCDGVVDGLVRSCYSGPPGTAGVGLCKSGNQKCNATPGGSESYGDCIGEVLPAGEACDGLDNDCNGKVDDQVGDGQGHTTGDTCCPYGTKCGIGACTNGSYQCVGNAVVCAGGQGPVAEMCDTLDNDCNGTTDDLPGLGTVCVQPGGCAGVLACDTTQKLIVCTSPTTPTPEVCNGVDDNCNGLIDEEPTVSQSDPHIGVACDVPAAPNNLGACKPGVTVCSNGGILCDGSIKPGTESCNGLDDDCDGIVDDQAPCPPGSSCKGGQCVEPCEAGEFPCPGGFACQAGFCVSVSCDGVSCPSGQVCAAGKCVAGSGGASGSSGQGGSAGATGGSAGKAGAAGTTGTTGGTAGASAGAGGAGVSGSSGQGGAAGTTGGVGGSAGAAGTTGTAGSGATGGVKGGSSGSQTVASSDGVFGLATGGGGCATSPGDGPPARLVTPLALAAVGLLAARRRSSRRERSSGGAR